MAKMGRRWGTEFVTVQVHAERVSTSQVSSLDKAIHYY